MATTLILKIRAEALRANLDNMKSHLENMPDPRKDLAKVEGYLVTTRKSLGEIHSAVYESRIALESESCTPKNTESLSKAQQQLAVIIENMRETGSLIESMRKKFYRIQETDIGKSIEKDLSAKTDPRIQALIEIETGLEQSGTNLQQLWKLFADEVIEINQSIFEQYIEFLGGLALRDSGFDTGISRLADELLRTYSTKKNPDPMLAIPTRQQAVAMTLARIIRVTFPDWTIWALPATAYEFWHVMARKDLNSALTFALRSATGNGTDAVDLRFDECLGDAFATYTMGPAYAYFAIFLLLDPEFPFKCGDSDVAADARAHCIFEMLRRMDSKESPLDPPYAKVRQELESAWRNAITQIGAQPKSDEEENRVKADKIRISILTDALWKTLNKSTSPPFTVDVWNEIRAWVDPLLENNVDAIKVPQGAELRHVLNAAWMARVDSARDLKLDVITAAANDLAKKISKAQGR
jgi:hypothetical protein